jgi:hypothetical protein
VPFLICENLTKGFILVSLGRYTHRKDIACSWFPNSGGTIGSEMNVPTCRYDLFDFLTKGRA